MASPFLKRLKFCDASAVTLEVDVSSFFKAGFAEGRFQEGAEGLMRLPEDAAEVVEDFVKWVYTGETMEMKPETFLDDDGAAVVYRRIVALYGLAEKVCCVALKKVLVDRLFTLLIEINKAKMPCNFPLTKAVREAYAVTPTGSALRKLIVATDCYLVEIDWFLKEDGAEETLNLGDEHATAVFRGSAAKSAFRDDGNPFTQESAEHFYDEDMKTLAKAMPEDVYTGLDPKKN